MPPARPALRGGVPARTAVKRAVLPTSLFGRSLLIIVLPVALMQIAVTWAFFDAHWQTVTSRLSEGLAGDVAWAVRDLRGRPLAPGARQAWPSGPRSMSLSIALQKGRRLPTGQRPLAVRLARPLAANGAGRAAGRPVLVRHHPLSRPTSTSASQVHGGVLRIIAPRDRAFATQGHIFILWMMVATLLLTAVAILFIRNQVRAIERLADAADAFGQGRRQRRLQAARRARGAPGGRRPSWP